LDTKSLPIDYNDPRTVDIKRKFQPIDYNEPRIIGIRIKSYKNR
jgi:hypothetical protein